MNHQLFSSRFSPRVYRRAALSRLAASLVLAGSLAACGGGGGGGATGSASPGSIPEGIWSGTTSTGYAVSGLILENGEYYVLYGVGSTVYGMVQGSMTGNGSSYSSSNAIDFSLVAGGAYAATVSGSFGAKTSLAGTIAYSASSSRPTFGATYVSSYDTAATLPGVGGTWQGRNYNGETATVVVNGTTGAVTGSTSGGCSFTGTAVPRPSGKSVYNVTVTYGAAPCALPGVTLQAVAVQSGSQLVAAGLNGSRTGGFLFIGAKI